MWRCLIQSALNFLPRLVLICSLYIPVSSDIGLYHDNEFLCSDNKAFCCCSFSVRAQSWSRCNKCSFIFSFLACTVGNVRHSSEKWFVFWQYMHFFIYAPSASERKNWWISTDRRIAVLFVAVMAVALSEVYERMLILRMFATICW